MEKQGIGMDRPVALGEMIVQARDGTTTWFQRCSGGGLWSQLDRWLETFAATTSSLGSHDTSKTPLMHGLLLTLLAYLAFFCNLHLSLLEGSEGLYAHIAKQVSNSKDFLHLTYQEEPYANKPPLYFWILALFTSLLGENEVALRLPASLTCLGTMALAYSIGKHLFCRTAGFWAAVVVATTFVSLWYGRRVLFDAALTFFMTLAVYAWMRAHILNGGSWWYLASFLAMGFGSMTKGLHAFGLPLVLILVYSILRRDVRLVKEPMFYGGFILFGLLMWAYSSLIGDEFHWHVDIKERLVHAIDIPSIGHSHEAHPVYWYLEVMWYLLFPWCALIPSSIALLLSRRSLLEKPQELFVLLWPLTFFLALSLGQPKREPYLMVLVPGLALMVGYLYHSMYSSASQARVSGLKLFLILVAVSHATWLFHGPSVLEGRWDAPFPPFPLFYVLLMLGMCCALLVAVARSWVQTALIVNGAMAVGFMVGWVTLVLPAIDRAGSPRQVSKEIKALAQASQQPVLLYSSGWPRNEDLVYYLSLEPTIPRIKTEGQLLKQAQRAGGVVLVVDEEQFPSLGQRTDLSLTPLYEFRQARNKNTLLIGVQIKKVGPPPLERQP